MAIWGTEHRETSKAVPSNTTALFTENRASLVDYAASLVGSRAQAEDLVQEAWVRLQGAVEEHIVREPLAYLYRIIRNLALDGHRAALRERQMAEQGDLGAAYLLATHSVASPEKVALHKDELALLLKALDDLPRRTRIAFGMHRIGGYKLREIAAHLDISLPLAQTLVADGLEHCKERLGWA